MKYLLTSAALITALSGTAIAGDAQLAGVAGVDAASYTNAEMIRIIEARREGDLAVLSALLAGDNRGEVGTAVTPGSAQLAQLAGVEPGVYTPAELTVILQAQEDGDTDALNFYLSHANRRSVGDTIEVTQARAQLAALAGLDPATATLTEIARSQPD